MTLTISWLADTEVVDAPGRPGLYCPAVFRAKWGDFELSINVTEGQVTTSDLRVMEPGRTYRSIVQEKAAEAIAGACWAVEQLTPAQLSQRAAHRVTVRGKPSRPKLTDDYLAEVARIHEQTPAKPTTAVAERFGLAQNNAAQHVAIARRKGFLPPASDGERVGASSAPRPGNAPGGGGYR